MRNTLLALSFLLPCAFAHGQNAPFHKPPPLFCTAPDPKKSVETITRFGPVGMSIELHQPAFTMCVGTIEPGSPAEATGAFKKGQIIESINGQVLKDIDPSIQLGQIIAAAEATYGIVKFAIKDLPAPVEVKIPVLGSYSKTWPLNCPKPDKIVRNFAGYGQATATYNVYVDCFSPGQVSGVVFLCGNKMISETQGADFGPEMSALANCFKAKFGGDDVPFFYSIPTAALAPNITKPQAIKGPHTALEITEYSAAKPDTKPNDKAELAAASARIAALL